MSKLNINADIREANVLVGALSNMDRAMGDSRTMQALTNSAYGVMRQAFNIDTAQIAMLQPEEFHHVYEPGHAGEPGMQLFTVKLRGTAGNRVITWDWQASKVTVPTVTGPNGQDRWSGANEKFDRERLRRVHVFVWRAPMMEYGVQVTVRPSLSARKLLVFPNQEVNPGAAHRGPVFTNKSYTFTPGEEVQGNFTAWFARWWGEGMAEQSLKGWEQKSERDFQRSFARRMAAATKAKRTRGGSAFTIDTAGPREGALVASLVSGDMRQNYIADARRRRAEDDDEDDEY